MSFLVEAFISAVEAYKGDWKTTTCAVVFAISYVGVIAGGFLLQQ